MLGKTIFPFLAFVFVLAHLPSYAQQVNPEDKNSTPYQKQEIEGKTFDYLTITGREVREKDFKLGPGMEVIRIKGTNIVTPKGTRAFDMGSWIKVEDLGEFLGRRFDEIQTRLQQLKEEQEQLGQELKEIRESLEELNQKSLTPK